HPEKLVAAAITRLLAGRKILVHGGGSYRRNWLHVVDNVEAIYHVIDCGEVNEAYHIASDEEYSVREVVAKGCARLGRDYDEVVDPPTDGPGADTCYALNCGKLNLLGRTPTRRLEESLHGIIEHYRQAGEACQPTPVS